MTTLFTKIIRGEIPAEKIWDDGRALAFLSIDPMTEGHALVVPKREVDHWLDADDALLSHLMFVARRVGKAQQAVWDSPRVGLMVQGFEVPHLHVHVWPVWSPEDYAPQGKKVSQEELAAAAEKLRAALDALAASGS